MNSFEERRKLNPFEVFLKNRPKNILYYSFFDDSNFVNENKDMKPDNCVNVKALGECAWKAFLPPASFPNSMNYEDWIKRLERHEFGYYQSNKIVFFMLAVACLGEIEIKKRLEKLDQTMGLHYE
jgi:hypothetical protein